MQHSLSCDASRFSASQEIPRILWNPNKPVNYVLTARNRVLLVTLVVSQLVKKFPTFYGTQKTCILRTHSMEQSP